MKKCKYKEIYPQNLLEELYKDKFSEQEILNIDVKNVEKAIKSLSEKYVEIVALRYKQFLTLKEISKIYGITQTYTRDILLKAKRILRQENNTSLITGTKLNKQDFSENDDISFLKLNWKTCGCLKLCGNIDSISDLMKLSKNQLLKIRGIGQIRANEIIKSVYIFKQSHNIEL